MERGRGQPASAQLHAVLDAAGASSSQDAAAAGVAGAPAEAEALVLQLQEEQVLRQRAEAQAQNQSTKLRVAQEQIAEWAQQKEKDAQDVLQQVQTLEQSLQAALAGAAVPSEEVLKQLRGLRSLLQDSADEAQAFAVQQRADVERSKRSSQQAGFAQPDEDTDMKRQKEHGPDANGSSEGLGGLDGSGGGGGGAGAAEGDVAGAGAAAGAEQAEGDGDEDMDADPHEGANGHAAAAAAGAGALRRLPSGAQAQALATWAERAKYIPMRLQEPERRLLRLLEAALNVSEYTDKVDILVWRSKTQRVHTQIKDICAILSGLVVAQDYRLGQELVKDRSFADNQEFFQAVFEIGRRYKIMNPDKMRTTYGKLMYMLMDSADPQVQELLEFRCVKPLQTVATFLEERGAAALLADPLLPVATQEIVAGDRPRYEVQRDIKSKEKAREALARRYSNAQINQEQLLTAIFSLSDNNTYLFYNRDPIDRVLQYFHAFYRPDAYEEGFSLAIQGGKGGARLTHNHERQYHYVLQSLTLWREISTEMFKLWYLAEQDLLRESNTYRLCDTGQGANRVQSAPHVGRAMQAILGRCQQQIGSWVGSSVVHLGDHAVPNSLIFVDKYTQVPRILNPLVIVLDELPKLYRDPELRQYIDSAFGGVDMCRKIILTDFCRHAFDGSGADNFFDAGSCIDGRLTSAWNWCERLPKKSYYPIFKLAGFSGFDGDWKA